MSVIPDWWSKPRNISVLVDNDSWILPYARSFVEKLNLQGEQAVLCRNALDITQGAVAFYFGCTRIVSSEVLSLNKRNLVVHESDLPKGRGFSPLTWQILEGINEIPICLLEAVNEVDAGNIIYKDKLVLDGSELLNKLRHAQGLKTIELCSRFLNEEAPISGVPQSGNSSNYSRRTPEDSKLDISKTIDEQFQLLRVVDNDKYPAFFEKDNYRYIISIKRQE